MPISLLTNMAALNTQRELEQSGASLNKTFTRLSSGQQVGTPGDDPSGFAIAASLENNMRSVQQARRNAQDAKSLVQVAEGALNEVNNLTLRLRELAVFAASDLINDEARDAVQIEADETKSEIDRIANTTRYFK